MIFQVLPYPELYKFLTAPEVLNNEIRFVVGGDMYHDDLSFMVSTSKRAALFNPLFAVVGGDIAYAVKSGFFAFQKPERWIEWVKAWHSAMVTPRDILIPVIAAIGNHDLTGQYNQTPAQAAIFCALFPMPGKQVYNVLDFNSYLTLVLLDSGHANPIDGKQAEWLKQRLAERKHFLHRFAIYHVPAYPSIRDMNNDYSMRIRKAWVPIFEEGGIQTAFEHHDHAYKRTFPLFRGRMNPDGIVYLGDGGWGVETPRLLKRDQPYLAKFAPARHFIGVVLTPNQQQFKAITDQGLVIDDYSRPIRKEAVIELEPVLGVGAK